MCNFITDRPPTIEDADNNGDIAIKRRPADHDFNTICVHWSYVKPGTPWRRTRWWKPARELPGINGQWIRANVMMPHSSDADEDGEVQVYGQKRVWRIWSAVSGDCLWRPSPAKDKRSVVPAGNRLPGYWGEMISGRDTLPTAQDANRDGEVVVVRDGRDDFRRWDMVGCDDHWRPLETVDTRLRRGN